jgi:hypothetical protein
VTREHIFKECPRWASEIRDLWRDVRKDVGWRNPRWKSISQLFQAEKATAAILAFLKATGVGKMPGRERLDGWVEGRDRQEGDDSEWDEE